MPRDLGFFFFFKTRLYLPLAYTAVTPGAVQLKNWDFSSEKYVLLSGHASLLA